jgi:hypothetical protein
MQKNYRIRIVRNDAQFEAEGDKAFVLAMLERFESGGATPAPRLPAKHEKEARQAQPDKLKKATSAGEFIRTSGIKKHIDTVVAFGYYLEKFQGVKAFTPADINNCYYDAKMESSNTSHMIILNIRRGYLMEAKQEKGEGRKKYTVTSSGEQFVEELIRENQHSK